MTETKSSGRGKFRLGDFKATKKIRHPLYDRGLDAIMNWGTRKRNYSKTKGGTKIRQKKQNLIREKREGCFPYKKRGGRGLLSST